MPPRKLTEADKDEILQRYRLPDETTTTLAEQYGVSTSTISRILKQNLDDEEYEALIQQKRSGRSHSEPVPAPEPVLEPVPEPELPKKRIISQGLSEPESSSKPKKRINLKDALLEPVLPIAIPPVESLEALTESEVPRRRQRKRSSAVGTEDQGFDDTVPQVAAQLELMPIEANLPFEPQAESSGEASLITGEEFDDLDDDQLDDLDDDLDDLDDLGDDDDLDEDFDDFAAPIPLATTAGQKGQPVQILPFTQASMPRTCYIVIDRSAELITRPLRDFADLGQIPAHEMQERILPIFDNHRIAKRFSRRMQRIVKVPDGRVFHKVSPYLQAKGITRLLIDGQVYTLS